MSTNEGAAAAGGSRGESREGVFHLWKRSKPWIHKAVLRMKPRRKRRGMISGKQRTSRFITDS